MVRIHVTVGCCAIPLAGLCRMRLNWSVRPRVGFSSLLIDWQGNIMLGSQMISSGNDSFFIGVTVAKSVQNTT